MSHSTQHFASAQRKDDIAIIVHHNNSKKEIVIENCNDNTTKLLGYIRSNLIGRNINRIFAHETQKFINENINYDDPLQDIAFVFSKTRYCKIITQDNNILDAKIKVFPTYAEQHNTSCELLIRTFSFIDKLHKFHDTKINHDSLNIIPELNIYNHDSIIHEIKVLQEFHNVYGGESLVGYIALNSKAKMDLDNINLIIKAYKSCTRSYDLIGYANNNYLIFVILDCQESNITPVVQRIIDNITQAIGNKKRFVIKYGSILHKPLLDKIIRLGFK